MLRPERLRIVAEAARAGCNILEARVTDVIYQGDTYLVQAELADGGRISRARHRGERRDGAGAAGRRRGAAWHPREDTVLVADTDE